MTDQILPRLALGGQDTDATFKFLEFVFLHYRQGFVEFRYSSPDFHKAINPPEFFSLPLDRLTIEQQVLKHSSQEMISFSPAPRLRAAKRGKTGTDADVAEISCIWAALDYDQVPGGAIEVIRRVKDLKLRPSVTINSGYGRHLYYVFNGPLRDGRLLDWQALMHALRDALGGNAVTDPSTAMCLPGTFNLEYDQPVLSEIVEEDSSWTYYSLDEVKDFLNSILKFSKIGVNSDDKKSIAESGLPSAINVAAPSIDVLRERQIPSKIIEAVITGKYPVGSGLNTGPGEAQANRDLRIAVSLLEKGFTEEEVKSVFRDHPSGCGNRWNIPRHGEKYLNLTVEKAAVQIAGKYLGPGKEGWIWSADSMPPLYQMDQDGMIYLAAPPAREGGEPKLILVAESLIYITEIHENIDTGQISAVIAYDYLGRRRSTKILRSQMCDTRGLVAALSGEGAPVSSNNARQVVAYLTAYEHAFADHIPRKKVTSKFGRGRAGKAFFLPGLSSQIEFSANSPGDGALYRAYASRKGTVKDWSAMMNELAESHSMIPQIAVVASFVPPLQRMLQIPNFIVDIYGNTSSGKSTTLKLSASVFGNPIDPDSLIHQWTNTKTAIEQVAGMCSELPIYLDDAQHCSAVLKQNVIYMIANGRGKARGARGGGWGIQETMTWQTVALSTSEEPLHESSQHEGVRGRLLPIGGTVAPFPANSGALVQALERAVAFNHGIAGETFIRHLNGWSEKDWMNRQRQYAGLRGELQRSSSSDIVGRVSGYISAISVAAQIACPLLGLRFKADVLSAWLLNHLHEQQSEQNIILLALRSLADYYISNLHLFAGSDAFTAAGRTLQGAAKRGEYVGFLRSTVDAIFLKRKWNQTAILNKMAEAGVLHATEADRYTKKISVAGIKHRMICIKWSALLPDDNRLTID